MKRMVTLLCSMLLLIFTLYGCVQNSSNVIETQPPATEIHLPSNTLPIIDPITEPTVIATQPDMSLHIDAGSFLLKYSDENTGDYLDYYLFIPENAEINMPLIIFLHGDGEVGKPHILENYGIRVKVQEFYGDEPPFIGLSPCTHVADWTSDRVSGTLYGLILDITKNYQIDPNRIIITGHSIGAIGVWHMISTYGDFFAGAVPVSCGTNEKLNLEMCAKVPILGIVGNKKPLEYNFYKAMVKLTEDINEAGGDANLLVLDGFGHEDTSRSSFTQEAFEWMLQQKKEKNHETIQ